MDLNSLITVGGLSLAVANTWTANQSVDDDILLQLGADGDNVLVNRSTSLAADAELSNVIVGTSDHQGVAANSLILSNITQDGDILGLINNGGNSLEWLLVDASAQTIDLGFAVSGIINLLGGGVDIGSPGTNAAAQGDMSIAGDLRVETDVNLGQGILYVDQSLGSIGVNGVADGHKLIDIQGGFTSDGGGSNAYGVWIGPDLTAAAGDTVEITTLRLTGKLTTPDTGGAVTWSEVGTAIVGIPNITKTRAGDTITDAFGLLIEGAPTEGSNNAALWVQTGATWFEAGNVLFGAKTADSITNGDALFTNGFSVGSDAAANQFDDASNGAASTTMYIGNETIDTTASARRWKENITPVHGSAREHLAALSGLLSEYDYRDGSGHFVGLVAERVRPVLPQYVIGNDTPSLKYNYMVPPLLWGWQEHDARIAELEAELAQLKGTK